jgi:NADPH-dependent ferric siderophore reductase
MGRQWRIRVQPAGRTPFEFKATLLLSGAGEVSPLDVSFLYGDGDLAVFLEDLGAVPRAICALIEELHGRAVAEIPVDVTDEAMEVLTHRRREARA